jgi:hypothetical protein
MKTWIIRIVVAALGNALALWVASLVFSDMSIDAWSFVAAVAIFTIAAVAVKALAEMLFDRYASGFAWAAGLATTLGALAITNYFSDGLSISGFGTWVGATVVVWLGTLAYDMVDDKLISALGDRLGVPDIGGSSQFGGPQQATG